eukprot:COSAG02_NODE_32598_length_513_cov_6.787440_2_plen_21_part_01
MLLLLPAAAVAVAALAAEWDE